MSPDPAIPNENVVETGNPAGTVSATSATLMFAPPSPACTPVAGTAEASPKGVAVMTVGNVARSVTFVYGETVVREVAEKPAVVAGAPVAKTGYVAPHTNSPAVAVTQTDKVTAPPAVVIGMVAGAAAHPVPCTTFIDTAAFDDVTSIRLAIPAPNIRDATSSGLRN